MPTSLKPIEKLAKTSKKVSRSDHEPKPEPHCLADLPTGSKIGKLKIMRSGRVIMDINNEVLDVRKAIPSECFEVKFCFL